MTALLFFGTSPSIYLTKEATFLIRPVVSYGTEAWTLTKKEEKVLLIFEWKIFRRIYGPVYENGKWKSRTSRELEEMSKGENTHVYSKVDKRAKDKLVRSPR